MMAQRAKRRSPQARKAPPWVSDDVLAKLGAALGDDSFPRDARRTPFVWSDGVLRVVDHLGGVLAPSELEAPLDELVGHHVAQVEDVVHGGGAAAAQRLRISWPRSGMRPCCRPRMSLRISPNCLTSWLTCWTVVPDPLAMRRRREPLISSGWRRS